ncbi:uncharacterized protein LOC131649781 [Vicia villosa]|uniref:uncharacterized protein LOC131649781 n=1 Tax=Vicia villosa TaxID=3911 RepID=UPI00273AEF1E|nr:uncharacterized protein LOC131649781 [Vicia villosa]
MAFEQIVKDLQAQNAQFQQMFISLAKGQEDLKNLITKKEKKKSKVRIGVLNMGRRFRGPIKVSKEIEIPKGSVKNDDEEEVVLESDEEEEYLEEQYPPAEEKYKLLEDRLNAMENQRVPGLDFEDTGLILGVFIPPKFKIHVFVIYDGASYPKLHLRSYVRKIQPHTDDKKLWVQFFQESLAGTQLEWFYLLEGANIRRWEDLAVAFYKKYQYNADLAPTRTQLQSMSMGPKGNFKEYAQRWKDIAGRVQPPLPDKELVDMFMGTLFGPFYCHLLRSSSSSFTDLIFTRERVESGIRNGKIQMATSSGAMKKSYSGKNEANAMHKGRVKSDHNQSVGEVLISKPTPQPSQQQNNLRRQDAPRRQFTRINMSLTQALQHLLKAELLAPITPHPNPNTSLPRYNPNARCMYHSNSPGHDTNNFWTLKNEIQDMIYAGEIEFDPPETPHVITAPMPNHGKAVNDVGDGPYVFSVADLTTSLLIVKKMLLQAGLFPRCEERCHFCKV